MTSENGTAAGQELTELSDEQVHAAAGHRWCRRASQVNGQAEVTINGMRAVTSRWSFT